MTTMHELEQLLARLKAEQSGESAGAGQAVELLYAVESFLLASDANGLSAATTRWYRSLLKPFGAAFAGRAITSIQPNELRAYIVALMGKATRYEGAAQRPALPGKLSENTLVGYSTALHAFWSWTASEWGIANPMRNIRRLRPPEPTPKAIDGEDFRKLIDATGVDEGGYRDRAILAFFADTGVRLGGLTSLKVDNLLLDQRKAVVIEKGKLTRIVPYTQAVRALLQLWLLERKNDSSYVFTALTTGQRLTASGVEQVMKRLKKRAGVTGRVNPHSYRHRFALEYIKNGGDMITTAKLLGHRDVNTTSKMYALFSDDELAELHEQRSPLRSLMEAK